MLTAALLSGQGRLVQWHLRNDDDRQEERCLYLRPALDRIIARCLPGLPPERRGRRVEPLSPHAELIDWLDRFVAGQRLYHGELIRMTPQPKGIWEWRPRQTRLYGWFERPCVFIAAGGALSSVVHAAARNGTTTASQYRRGAERLRRRLNLSIDTRSSHHELLGISPAAPR